LENVREFLEKFCTEDHSFTLSVDVSFQKEYIGETSLIQ